MLIQHRRKQQKIHISLPFHFHWLLKIKKSMPGPMPCHLRVKEIKKRFFSKKHLNISQNAHPVSSQSSFRLGPLGCLLCSSNRKYSILDRPLSCECCPTSPRFAVFPYLHSQLVLTRLSSKKPLPQRMQSQRHPSQL
jgi:hypothetical protein